MANNQITPFQLTDQFTMDNFNQRINETNTALQKKAEGGYGYGGDSISYQFTGDSDGSKFDNAINAFLAEKKAGIFQIKFQSHPFLNTVGCVGTLWTFGDGKYAVIKGVSYFGELVQRTRYDGVWSPWEWTNPAMKLGVEYRTTERYQGKPVYTKSINLGNTDKWVADSITSLNTQMTGLVDCVLEWRMGTISNDADNMSGIKYWVVPNGSILDSSIVNSAAIKMFGTDNWGGNKILTMKYTKD